MRKNSLVSGIVFGALTLVPMSGWSQSSSQTPGTSGSKQQGSSDTSTGSSSTDTSTRGSTGSMRSSSAAHGKWSREDVKSVQEALKGKGHNPGPIDGVMGPQTQQALKEFQRAQNIQQTGQLDSSTASALGVQLSSDMGAGSSSSTSGSSSGMGSSTRGSSAGTGSSPSGPPDTGAGSGSSKSGTSGSSTGAGSGSPSGSGSSPR